MSCIYNSFQHGSFQSIVLHQHEWTYLKLYLQFKMALEESRMSVTPIVILETFFRLVLETKHFDQIFEESL